MASRREFVRTAGTGLGAAALGPMAFARTLDGAPHVRRGAVRPAVIASANGLEAVQTALRILNRGGDTL
jgi:hypothetical protein